MMLAARGTRPPCSFGISKSILGCDVNVASSVLSPFRYKLGNPHSKKFLNWSVPIAPEGKAFCQWENIQCLKFDEERAALQSLKKASGLYWSQPCRRREVTCSVKKSSKSEGPKEDKKPASAPRVSTDINIPLRYQLRYVKALKEYRKTTTGAPPTRQATGYRRKKEKASENNGTLSGDVVAPSTSLMGQSAIEELNLEPPVLLVDGYNMCGYWPKLKKHFSKGDLEIARSKLIVELQTYGACKGIRVVVVFDAQKSGLLSHSEGDKYLEVVYSADDTADSWIEKEAKALNEKGNHNVWVVTSDLAQQSMAYGFGATVWSCGLLIQEINQARKEMLKQLEEDRMIGELANRPSTFEESVPRASLDQLASLKAQLSRSEDEASGRYSDVSSRHSDVSSEELYLDDEDSDSEWLSEWANESDSELSDGAIGSGETNSLQNERIASNGSAETSDQRREEKASTAAIPVAFGKGRVNLGAAVKKRRQSGEGYSSGSDSEGPSSNGRKRAGINLRDPSRDLEIFQRFDTLPDFGYSTGEDEDHRGRMHRRWREDVRNVTANKQEGTNGKKGNGLAGPVLRKEATRDEETSFDRSEAIQNGHLSIGREESEFSPSVNENGRLKRDQGSETMEADGQLREQEGAENQNGVEETTPPLIIRSTTKRVPGQSPRVAKPRFRSSVETDSEERMQPNGNAAFEGQASRSRSLNLLKNSRSEIEELETKKGRALSRSAKEGTVRRSKPESGLRKRLEPPPLPQASGDVEFEHADKLYRDLESTPFEELSTEQLLALKYGHSPETENGRGQKNARKGSKNLESPFSKLRNKRTNGR